MDKRPSWLREEGVVLAWSMEPLPFRVRRDGGSDYTPTPQQRAAYLSEYTPEMVERLKSLGVNLVMIHCYKGAGLRTEGESMAEAVKYARRLHEAGLHVAVYTYSGTLLWDTFFQEVPQSKDWLIRDARCKPLTYSRAPYRYRWDRNNPEAVEFFRGLVRFAVEDIKTDVLHFDNYSVGPGSEANSAARFRRYLREVFPQRLLSQAGITDIDTVEPPLTTPCNALLHRAWLDFCCRSLADSYHDMCRYARTLRGDVLVECNPNGVHKRIEPPVDHGRFHQAGEGFWDERVNVGYNDASGLQSRIRTFKVARRMDNTAFAYVNNPLHIAESLAFNLDCLGGFCEFEWGQIHSGPGKGQPLLEESKRFVHFYRSRRDLYNNGEVVADAAVLRSFPSQVFAPRKDSGLTYAAEEDLILKRACFQIIYDHHLDDLRRYRVLVLAGCTAMSDEQLAYVGRFIRDGGRLVLLGPLASHDQWMLPRERYGLADLLPGVAADLLDARVIRIDNARETYDAVVAALQGRPSLEVRAKPGLCAELIEQHNRHLIHLVNYRNDGPQKNIQTRLLLPEGRRVQSITLAGAEHETDLPVPFAQSSEYVTFNVPGVGVYRIAIVDYELHAERGHK